MTENQYHLEIQDIVAKAFRDATDGLGKINILVVGKTGVGKSTLINSIFRGDFAKTGSGAPVTQGIEEITKPGHPLTIIDTKGIEVADYQKILDDLDEVINNRTQSIDPNVHIHAAWICINCKSSRVEAAEVDLCNYLNSKNIPVITVITKSGKKDPFIQKVKELLPNANATIPVRAQDEEDHDEEPPRIMKSHGLNELIRETAKLIPESQKRAFSAALNTRNAQALEVKREQAEKEVIISAGLAATAAAIPVPFSDAFTLVPIQVGMFAKIGVTFGMKLSTTTLTTLVTSALGSSAASLLGRAIVGNIAKFLPGIGSAAGSAISATTAGTLTKAIGEAYISVLFDFCKNNPGAEIDIPTISSELKRKFSL